MSSTLSQGSGSELRSASLPLPLFANLPFGHTQVHRSFPNLQYALLPLFLIAPAFSWLPSRTSLETHPPHPSVTIVGYGMKRQRYEEVHRAALRWPSHAFNYIGIDNDHEQEADYLGEVSCLPFPLCSDTATRVASVRRRIAGVDDSLCDGSASWRPRAMAARLLWLQGQPNGQASETESVQAVPSLSHLLYVAFSDLMPPLSPSYDRNRTELTSCAEFDSARA